LPWSEVYFKVDEGSYRIIAPVKLGLYYCYSDICRQYETKYFYPIADMGGSVIKATSEMAIPGLFPERFEALEQPFYIASMISSILLLIASLICCLNVSLYFYCLIYDQNKSDQLEIFDKCRLLLSSSTLLSSAAAVSYMVITTNLLEGGRYLIGMWVVLSASVVGVVSVFYFFGVDDEPHYLYSHIPDENNLDRSRAQIV
jgi:hypothetical protein